MENVTKNLQDEVASFRAKAEIAGSEADTKVKTLEEQVQKLLKTVEELEASVVSMGVRLGPIEQEFHKKMQTDG